MDDHPADVEFALGVALKFGVIRTHEKKEMRSLISRYGLASFESLCRVREQKEQPEEGVYQQLGTTKAWVDGRLA